MESTATHLAVTFLRSHPAFGYFPGTTALVELAAARQLVEDGFAEPANPAERAAYPVADDAGAPNPRPAFAGYADATAADEKAVEPAAQPTKLAAFLESPEAIAAATDGAA
ncbi:MAG: hypothetical protein NVS3B25_34290 [Hymenobacter sp.]